MPRNPGQRHELQVSDATLSLAFLSFFSYNCIKSSSHFQSQVCMKTFLSFFYGKKNLFFFLCSMALIAVLTTFCKKDDTEYVTATPDNPPAPIYTDKDPWLQDPAVMIMTEEETNSNATFLPYAMSAAQRKVFNPYQNQQPNGEGTAVVKIFVKIMSLYEKMSKKKDFNQITNDVQEIISQDQQILNGITALQSQLELMQVNILNFISNLAVNIYITSIKSAYSTTGPSGLLYFSQFAKDIQNGVRPESDTVQLRQQSQNYIDAIYKIQSPNIPELIAQIHGQICPDVGGTKQSVLNTYCDYILLNPATNFNNKKVHDPVNVMKSYLLLENYFLHLVNSQHQGAIILGNVYNQIDTTGRTYSSYLNGTFRDFIVSETDMFLAMTDKLAASLVDYRSLDMFLDDLQYLNKGIRSDSLFRGVMARSRFVAGLLRSAVNIDPIGYGFSVLIPARYNATGDINQATLAITHNGTPYTVNVDQFDGAPGIPGVYPYAYYQGGNTVRPDNSWFVYSQCIPVSLVKDGSNAVSLQNIPWKGTGLVRTDALSGNYTAMYYNPRHPDYTKATPVPTDSNTYKFAYTALSWRFGDLLTMQKASGGQKLSNTWRNTPVMTYAQQQTNPVSMWQVNDSKFKWQNTGYADYFQPALSSDTTRLYHHKFDPKGIFQPLRNGFKFFMAQGISKDMTVSPNIPGSGVAPQFFYSATGLAYNITGAGNTPCHTQFCMFLGGLGGFSASQNIPNNLFSMQTTDFSRNYQSFKQSGVSAFDASEGSNRFTLAWELSVDGAYKTPKGYDNFLPKVDLQVYGQMVYRGNWNIFNK